LDGLNEAISAKPQVEPEQWGPPPGQCLQALGFYLKVPTGIGQSTKRPDIVLASEADDGVAQGECDHQGSLHFTTAVLETADGRQQPITDPQAGQHCRKRCRAG